MKLMVASDIHGSAYFCEKLIDCFKRENAGKLLLLGDLLYHGPRNDLPKGYDPKTVIPLLNSVKDALLCVRGNCDSEVDQMVLEFPILADYCLFYINNREIFATHGHNYGETNPPPLKKGDILLCGHTHIPKCSSNNDSYFYVNPGSVTFEKEGYQNCYLTIEDDFLEWKLLDGSQYMRTVLEK